MSTEAEYKSAVADLKNATDEVKKFAETSRTEIKNIGEVSKETKAAADKALTEMNALSARVTEMEQKGARGSGQNDPAAQSIGEMFTSSDKFKGVSRSTRECVRVEMERKALTTGTDTMGTGTSGSVSLIPSYRVPGVNMLRFAAPTIRSLIPAGTTSSPVIEFALEEEFTNAAATVPEGATKPYSNITFNLARANVATIAHLFKASRQALDDAGELQSIINTRGVTGLRLTEEQQFLYGDGKGANLLGLMNQASVFAAPDGLVPPSDPLGMVRMAILQASLAEYPASAIVMHDVDWYRITDVKDSIGRYVIGDPQSVASPRLWGLPVVTTKYINQGDFLTGSFSDGAQIFDRQSIAVEIDTVNDDFEKNMVTVRVEERTALAVYRKEAFVKGTFSAATGGTGG